MNNWEEKTHSLCPKCLQKIEARRFISDHEVILEKKCDRHGVFKTVIWRGLPRYSHWKRPKIPQSPPVTFNEVDKGCPFDCGLCPDHNQRSCTIILEVTERCNLHCPVCYADTPAHARPNPPIAVIRNWFQIARQASKVANIQLSGGEPTLRDDLAEIIAIGKQTGFDFIQINTNGLRLAHDPAYVKSLSDAGLSSVFLQFDAVDDDTYLKIRGRKLLNEKRAAIETLEKYDIGIVLVPTLIPGINGDAVGPILKTAVKMSPTVRAVHFQPISYFGRYIENNRSKKRLTLPELIQSIESQTNGLFKVTQFNPPGCENSYCSFHGHFIILPDGQIMNFQKSQPCCRPPIQAEKGAAKSIAYVARQWASPFKSESTDRLIPDKRQSTSQKIIEPISDPSIDLDAFIARARTHAFAISAMAFQDVWNIDLERVRDCCIHVMSPNGKLIPFCLYNLTDAYGKKLYRQ